MSDSQYRCANCLDHALTRNFDVSHLSTTCANCGEFGRFVNGRVVAQFRTFEEAPPESLDWDALDRLKKFFISDQVARRGRSVEDFAGAAPE